MRQQLSRFTLLAGMLALACATAIDNDPPLGGDPGGGEMSGFAGALNVAGSKLGNTSGSTSAGSTGMSTSGSTAGGSSTNAFGGTATTGGSPKGGNAGSATAGTMTGGKASGGSGGAAGATAGGKGGNAGSAGSAAGGTGGSGTSGSANGGSGTAGSTSTTCNGVADWSSKTYAVGDSVADTCSGPFAGSCGTGQHHKFECNPQAGVVALGWCKDREPGVGNGWPDAWVDKGQCQ